MTSMMPRKPIGNFFIKKSLQVRLVIKIVIAALLSTLASTGSLILVYYIKYQTVIVYQLDKISQELNREHIVFLILPTLVVSAIVSILVSCGIGLYSSRKYAVPIYKLEQWGTLLKNGTMSARLSFREKDEMKELSDICNELTSGFRKRFVGIKALASKMSTEPSTKSAAQELNDLLNNIDLEKGPFEVTTGYHIINHDNHPHESTGNKNN